MKIQYLQHVPFEDPAFISDWAKTNGHNIVGTMLFDEHVLPDESEFDLLVVMGGPMGVHDCNQYPWLTAEKKLIEKTIHANKKVLGICLGAQLIADILGAKVYQNSHKEIGWFEVTTNDNLPQLSLFHSMPHCFEAFHWHGETFDIPAGATHLASSTACANQAFEYEGRVLALQFHLESTAQSIARLIKHGHDALTPGPYVQNPALMHKSDAQLAAIHQNMSSLLNTLT